MFLDVPHSRQLTPSSFKDFSLDYKPIIDDKWENTNHANHVAYGEDARDGPSHVFLQYVSKMLVTCVCIAGCSWQSISILQLFFAFPSTVFVYVETMDKLQLPGVTICNSNRIMMTKLREFNKTFDKIWREYDEYSDPTDNSTKLDKQQIVDQTIRSLLNSLTVNEFMSLGHNYEDVLLPEYFKCATDPYHPEHPCKKYANVLQTTQDVGNCFTLFHRSNSKFLEEIAIQSGLSQSPVIRGRGEAVDLEMADQPFHPNEIVRLKVNFSKSEYTKLNDEVFGHLIIHDNDELPPIREKNFYIYPGFYYEFFITKQSDHLLPQPYSTDCVDYATVSHDLSNSDSNEYLIHPQSKENCIIGCMAEKTIERCKCWPPELPFLRGSYADAIENKMKFCDWDAGPQIIVNDRAANDSWFRYCFSFHESECAKNCKSDCHIDRYSIIQQDRTWPPKERIEHSKHGEQLQADHECCAIVSIRYWTNDHTVNRYQPKYEIVEFVSYMGGLLSMWLGFSLIGTYGFIELIIIRFYKKNVEHIRRSRLSITSQTTNLNVAVDNIKLNSAVKSMRRKHTNNNNQWKRLRPRVSNLLIDNSIQHPYYN